MRAKPWLNDLSWQELESINQSLCKSQKVPVEPGKNLDRARKAWESKHAKAMELAEALDLCKQCNDWVPFTFNSGNTFATVSHRIVQDWIELLPSYEAHLLRTSIGHYVNGMITKRELIETLRHAESVSRPSPQAAPR